MDKWYHLLFPGDIDRIKRNMKRWAEAICTRLGMDVNNGEFIPCFGFIDGTARKTERPSGPSINQESLYDGHHRYHGFEYQAVTAPDGIVIMLFGPVPGRVNDLYMVKHSNIQEMIEKEFSEEEGGEQFFVYGDQGYMTTPFILSGKRNPDPREARMNRVWSNERVSVEWCFNGILRLFQTLDCFRMQKPQQRLVAVWYLVSTLFSNCYTCMKGKSEVSQHFKCPPPSLTEYLTPCDQRFEKWREEYRPKNVNIRMYGDNGWGLDHPFKPEDD